MDKIIDYQICNAISAEELEDTIKKELHEGWQPIGGLSNMLVKDKTTNHEYFVFYQALIKYETNINQQFANS